MGVSEVVSLPAVGVDSSGEVGSCWLAVGYGKGVRVSSWRSGIDA